VSTKIALNMDNTLTQKRSLRVAGLGQPGHTAPAGAGGMGGGAGTRWRVTPFEYADDASV
jgi:hypothetical protein